MTGAAVAELSRFYESPHGTAGTHLALAWKGRTRYTVPRESAGQSMCWEVFQPGRLGIALRAMTALPRLSGAAACVESAKLALVREATGNEAGLSSCRAGAAGPWSKDTVLLLDRAKNAPLFIVKAGGGGEVGGLLRNEASWLKTLRQQSQLAGHIPELVAHHSGPDFSFVAQRALSGDREFTLGSAQVDFLRRLQDFSRQTIQFEDSRLCRTLDSRLSGLSGLLDAAWSERLHKSVQRIKQLLSGKPAEFVAAHNDFTPWNIRIDRGVAKVFDWEYADYEQLPMFDALHFGLMPMALRGRPTAEMVQKGQDTTALCRATLGEARCCDAETQALSYVINLCLLYLWAERGNTDSNQVLESYARLIDYKLQFDPAGTAKR
jgi:hypothetical protein